MTNIKPKKSGRPVAIFDLKKVEEYASKGMTLEQIAHSLGYAKSTFARNKANNEALQEAYQAGRARGIQEVSSALFKNALSGNIAAQIFFLKSQGGWQERQQIDIKAEVVETNAKEQLLAKLIGLDEEDEKE